ncbi:methyltransferase domain-containing protein [Pyrobaculum sp.]|uniref:class I SAM-dependent methyltransferase n=1 Tax=Pyrobaculum sp. TaxID=2004705 RepID=UPI003163E2D5
MPPRPAKEIFATSGKEPWDISTILTLWYGDPQYGSFGKDLARVVSAVRLLLAAALLDKGEVTCADVERLCCGGRRLGVNYWVGDVVAVVEGRLGVLRKFSIPCAVDVRRMPPLARCVKWGLARIDSGRLVVDLEKVLAIPIVALIRRVFKSASSCQGPVWRVASCAKADIAEAAFALAALRLLYPGLFEIYGDDRSLNDVLTEIGVGNVVRAYDLWDKAVGLTLQGYLVSGGARPRTVRARSAKYSIPPILAEIDYTDAVVADVGSGFGTKGAATLRWGARYAVLVDVDESVLRERGNGLKIDKVVADAHMLPLRDRAADVVIFWNVYNFLQMPRLAVEEVGRVARRAVVFSVYNAASGRFVDFWEFLEVARRWGRVATAKRLGSSQFQAVVLR